MIQVTKASNLSRTFSPAHELLKKYFPETCLIHFLKGTAIKSATLLVMVECLSIGVSFLYSDIIHHSPKAN